MVSCIRKVETSHCNIDICIVKIGYLSDLSNEIDWLSGLSNEIDWLSDLSNEIN